MTDRQPDRIDVKIQPCPALGELERLWRSLEARAEGSFFLSWVWIGSWLEGVRDLPFVLTAHRSGVLVGLGLLGSRSPNRYGVSVPTLYLNQSGNRSEDSVFIEFNGFLVDRSCGGEVTAACLDYIINGRDAPEWTECVFSGVPDMFAALARGAGLSVVERSKRASPYVSLDSIRTKGGDYLSSLSRNTRYQIRRSFKRYEGQGNLRVAHASSVDEAQAWLSALAALHQKSWIAKGEAGSFANPFFSTFCTRLVTRGYPESVVDVVRVCAGSSVIGYLLNFIEQTRVMNYQSGFAYQADEYFKPGLTAHALAIEHALHADRSVYSFLAGDSQYKSSLSNASEELYWLTLQKKSGLLYLERGARRVKSWISVRSGRA